MSAAEDNGAHGQRYGHHKVAFYDAILLAPNDFLARCVAVARQNLACSINQGNFAWEERGIIVARKHQICWNALVKAVQNLSRHVIPCFVVAAYGRVQKAGVAAAGHVKTAVGLLPEGHALHVASALTQHGARLVDGADLHCATADGSADQAILGHQHLRSGIAWRGTLAFGNGDQHQVAAGGCGIQYVLCDIAHCKLPYSFAG